MKESVLYSPRSRGTPYPSLYTPFTFSGIGDMVLRIMRTLERYFFNENTSSGNITKTSEEISSGKTTNLSDKTSYDVI